MNFKKDLLSIHKESEIIEKVFEIIVGNKWCVEFGADDGNRKSNTWNLIINKGWSGVLIEGDNKKFQKLIKNYENINRVICINKFVSFSGSNSIDNILSETIIPQSIDLISIDIDGNDYHIWNSIKKFFPKVVIIEFNPSFPNGVEFIQPKNMKIKQGSSLLSIIKLAYKKEYELVAVTEINAIFVKKKYFELFNIKDNSPEMLYDDEKYRTYLYQLYDGTLIVGGVDKLIWHEKKINNKRIQVLPRYLRKFPGEYPLIYKIWIKFKITFKKAVKKLVPK